MVIRISLVFIVVASPVQAGKHTLRRELRRAQQAQIQEARYQANLSASFDKPFAFAPSVVVKPGKAATLFVLFMLTAQAIDAESHLENEPAKRLPEKVTPRPSSSTPLAVRAENSTAEFETAPECIASLPTHACWASQMVQAHEMKTRTHEIVESFARVRSPAPVHVAVLDGDFDDTLVQHFHSNGSLAIKGFQDSRTTRFSTPVSFEKNDHGTSVTSVVAARGPVGMVKQGIALTYYHRANTELLEIDDQLAAICDDLHDPDGIVIINRSSNEYLNVTTASGFMPLQLPIRSRTLASLSSKGCLVINSAGNFALHDAFLGDIADASLVIESVDSRRAISKFSDNGELYAPGENVLAMISGNNNKTSLPTFVPLSGTSFAAPIVTGIATNVVNILKNQPEAYFKQLKPSQRIELVNRILQHAHVRGVINGFKAIEIAYRWTEASKEIANPMSASELGRIEALELNDFASTSARKLKHAIFRNDARQIRFLLDHEISGKDLLLEDRFRDNLISYAIFHRRLEIIALLLDKAKPVLTPSLVGEYITHALRLDLPFVFKSLLENSQGLFANSLEQAGHFLQITERNVAKRSQSELDVFFRFALLERLKDASCADVVDGISVLLERDLYSSAYLLISRADPTLLTRRIEGEPSQNPLVLAIQKGLSAQADLILNVVHRDVFSRTPAYMTTMMEFAASRSMWTTVNQFAKRIRFSADDIRGLMRKIMSPSVSSSKYFMLSKLIGIVVKRMDASLITEEIVKEAEANGLMGAAEILKRRRVSD